MVTQPTRWHEPDGVEQLGQSGLVELADVARSHPALGVEHEGHREPGDPVLRSRAPSRSTSWG